MENKSWVSMSKPIEETERCELFEQIAETVWNRIIRAHEVNVDLKEIGITADILVDIQHYNKKGIPNFDLYAKPSWEENYFGSDIDVFIETNPNKYRWFALQAKILKKNNRYTTLRDSSDEFMQWEKLEILKKVSDCTPFYLLYNGKKDYSKNGYDYCDRTFLASQLGCSLVEPEDIEMFANKRNRLDTRYVNPTFEDIHPDYAEPWRILTCCYQETWGYKLYSIEQIISSDPNFKKLSFEVLEDDSNDIEANEKVNIDDNNNNNPITIACKEAKWNPGIRIVVNRTDNFLDE